MLTSYLALDVGRARVGLALANDIAQIAAPLDALSNDENFVDNLKAIIAEHDIKTLIVGWPRGLNGQETAQTEYVGEFIAMLKESLTVQIVQQDEAVTSVHAEAELKQRRGQYTKGDIDSLSAVYILEDYLVDEVH